MNEELHVKDLWLVGQLVSEVETSKCLQGRGHTILQWTDDISSGVLVNGSIPASDTGLRILFESRYTWECLYMLTGVLCPPPPLADRSFQLFEFQHALLLKRRGGFSDVFSRSEVL